MKRQDENKLAIALSEKVGEERVCPRGDTPTPKGISRKIQSAIKSTCVGSACLLENREWFNSVDLRINQPAYIVDCFRKCHVHFRHPVTEVRELIRTDQQVNVTGDRPFLPYLNTILRYERK